MRKISFKRIGVAIVTLSVAVLLPMAVMAADASPADAPHPTVIGPTDTTAGGHIRGGLLSGLSDGCIDIGDCSLCDVITVINNVMTLILGIVGSLALLAFIWGGFYMMFKGTEIGYFQKGKDIIKYALIGIILVFFAFNLVNLGLNILVGSSTGDVSYGTVTKLFGKEWANICATK